MAAFTAAAQVRVAHDDRIAGRSDLWIEDSLQADFRANAGRIADRNCDPDFVVRHGSFPAVLRGHHITARRPRRISRELCFIASMA
jgi:hypothetical protein